MIKDKWNKIMMFTLAAIVIVLLIVFCALDMMRVVYGYLATLFAAIAISLWIRVVR